MPDPLSPGEDYQTMSDSQQHRVSAEEIAETLGIENDGASRTRYIKWLLLAIVAIAFLVILWSLTGNDSAQALRYTTAEVTRGDLTIRVTATGALEPVNQVEVGSEISGTIREVLVDFNDRVKKGEVLAVMDTDQLGAKVRQARASLALAQAQVKQAEATVRETANKMERSQELAKTGMCSEEDCDTARAAWERAVADLERFKAQVLLSQASLEAEETTLAKATIHSPIEGIVLSRDVEPGQTVAASFQTPVLFKLAENLTQMELHVGIDEADVGQVSEGQPAEFTVDAYPNRTFPATITEVHFASQTVEGVVTYETVLGVDNTELLLRPGMTATADIMVRKLENTLLVPNAALRFSPPVQQTPSGNRGLVGSLLPHPPRSKTNRRQSENKQQKVWTLLDGEPVAIPLVTGATDGVMSELLEGEIVEGTPLIVDTLSSSR
ncbi:MAG: efflux RND transporter periplasmic adaptor subunit [Gammaproteobacteria bacterium]|jgi:HlyD family secretion protein